MKPSLASLRRLVLSTFVLISLPAALARNNPVPQIVGPVHPDAVAPGSGALTLSVYGANFVPGSVVNWNYQPRVTTYVSAHEIQAQILATDIQTNTARATLPSRILLPEEGHRARVGRRWKCMSRSQPLL